MNWFFMCKRLIIKGCPIFGIFGQTSVFGRRILASHTGVLSMAEPPNLVLQVNVSRSTLLVCIILFMCVCVCVCVTPRFS